MKTTIFFLSIIFVFIIGNLTAQSQVTVTNTEEILDKLRLNKSISGNEGASYSEITGSPFLFNDFNKGTIKIISGEQSEANIRYDVYANEMQIKSNNDIFAIVHPEILKQIELENSIFVFSNYVKAPGDLNKHDGSYFILKADGKCQLLVKKNLRIQDSEPPKLYQEAKPAKFISIKDTYYLKMNGMPAIKIDNKKDLLSAMENQKQAIDKFLNSNKVSYKSEDDLLKIVLFYNSL